MIYANNSIKLNWIIIEFLILNVGVEHLKKLLNKKYFIVKRKIKLVL